MKMRDAWVLRLKDESKEPDQQGEYYFDGHDVTPELKDAEIIDDKNEFITYMKWHEHTIFETYGKDAICNFGYTNMMKHFEFVEVEVSEVAE